LNIVCVCTSLEIEIRLHGDETRAWTPWPSFLPSCILILDVDGEQLLLSRIGFYTRSVRFDAILTYWLRSVALWSVRLIHWLKFLVTYLDAPGPAGLARSVCLHGRACSNHPVLCELVAAHPGHHVVEFGYLDISDEYSYGIGSIRYQLMPMLRNATSRSQGLPRIYAISLHLAKRHEITIPLANPHLMKPDEIFPLVGKSDTPCE
jgi:hypothetical protein